MKLKIKLFLVLLLIAFPQTAHADTTHNVYYLESDVLGNDIMTCKPYEFEGDFSDRDIAYILFYNLFDKSPNYIPEGTHLLDVSLLDHQLVLNVSHEMLSYGGGCYYETCLIKQILCTAFDIEGVNDVTLLVDGSLCYFPEGSLIYKVTDI